MITVYSKEAQTFTSLGLGTLLPSACVVTESLNGGYELSFTHPYDPWGKWRRIETGNILLAPTPTGPQPFRIYHAAPTMEQIEGKGRHLFYDLLDNLCRSLKTGVVPAGEALEKLSRSLAYPMPFSFSTDIQKEGELLVKNLNPVMALLSEEKETQSFITVFGGELERNGYHVGLKTALGMDRGVAIRYGKNLAGLEVTEDMSEVATRVYPIGKDGVTLSGNGYVDSEKIDLYPFPKIRVLEDNSTKSQKELKTLAEDFFAKGGDLPSIHIKANFQELSQTEEYKQYVVLETVLLGDIVTVVNPKMNFSKKAKVVSYTYDSLTKRYESIELGEFAPFLTDALSSFSRNTASSFRQVNTALSTLDGAMNQVDGGLSTLGSTVERLDGDLTALSSKVSRVDGDLTALSSKVTQLDDTVLRKTDISYLSAQETLMIHTEGRK